MEQLGHLKYPKKSHRKNISIPKHSSSLAEFCGIMIGDGGINNAWQANISVNSIVDAEFAKYVSELSAKLFKVLPSIRKRKDSNTLIISISSTSVVNFLVDQGLKRGNKLNQGLNIPVWISKNKNYKKYCVRGLIDTDGCLFIHNHKVSGKEYSNIGLHFSSTSPILIEQVASILKEFGIIPHIGNNGRGIYLYKAEAVKKYLSKFGTSNRRISSIYNKWRDARVV